MDKENKTTGRERLEELSLLVIYLSSWKEDSRNNPGEKNTRSWKSIRLGVIDELERQGLITHHRNSKSVVFTESGEVVAERLNKAYCKVDAPPSGYIEKDDPELVTVRYPEKKEDRRYLIPPRP